MDMGCQQQVLQQRIAEQIYTRTIFNDMLAGRQTFTGNEIVVTATRLGSETLSWAQSQLARDPFADTLVTATLPDGSVGYMLARSNGPAAGSSQSNSRFSAWDSFGEREATSSNWENTLGMGIISAEKSVRFVGCSGQAGLQNYYAGCGVVVGDSTSFRPRLNIKGNINWIEGDPTGWGVRVAFSAPIYSGSIFINSSGIASTWGFGIGGGVSASATYGYRGRWGD
jgi:hypothetical protein